MSDCEEKREEGSVPAFNGGKMNHIFKQTQEGKRLYVNEFTCEAAERCFNDPNATVTLKVDGECAMLKRVKVIDDHPSEEDGDDQIKNDNTTSFKWVFYRRQDNFKGEGETTPIPDGAQPAHFEGHNYCFIPLDENLVTGKGKRKSFVGVDTNAAIRVGVSAGLIPDPNNTSSPKFITVEWVGQKHQQNMDFCPSHHGIVVHGTTPIEVPRSFEEVAEMAKTCAIEGGVFEDKASGERFKLRFDLFEGSLFKQHKRTHKPTTSETTTIKPTIITKDGIVN
eukprot:m.84292 g.84292  ORF g.84292 m.84292 type:complete len:280 (+) comp12153_c1_seq2:145-984(+)